MVYREEGRKSWCMVHFIPDVVDPCYYGFIILTPRGHGAVIITC